MLLVLISEYMFGVNVVVWFLDIKFLVFLGVVNDGFFYLWKIDFCIGVVKLF